MMCHLVRSISHLFFSLIFDFDLIAYVIEYYKSSFWVKLSTIIKNAVMLLDDKSCIKQL